MTVVINGTTGIDTGTGSLIAADATTPTYLDLFEDTDNGSNYVRLIAPTSIAANRTLTLPNNTGTLLSTASTGTVLQVVNVDYGTETSNSTSTFADTGLTATITPTSSSSRILVFVCHAGCAKATGNTSLQLRLLRGASVILNIEDVAASNGSTGANYVAGTSATFLDSPATTSPVTYKTQFASRGNTAVVYVQAFGSVVGGTRSTITLMEIAG